MGEALLVLVREGFEASLIVGIVFGYLRKIGRRDLDAAVWGGVAIAAALSTAFGVILHLTVGSFEGEARLRTFALICASAALVLTWMVFWMRRQSRAIKGELQLKVDSALASDHVRTAILGVAFLAVLREGIETALFLIAAATGADGWDVFIGGMIGLAIACVLGYLVYTGSKFLPMKAFFQVTGMIVIVFAAGLCAKTVFFLQATGDLGTMNDAVYNLTGVHWLTVDSQVGRFLGGLFGWDPRPSAEQVIAWLLYIVPVTILFLRPDRTEAAPPPVEDAPQTDEPEDRAAAALAAES